MSRRRRLIIALLAGASALVCVALLVLWVRSGSRIDAVGWTTARLDTAAAVRRFPAVSVSGMGFTGAVDTFSIASDQGQIRFERALYLRHDPRPSPQVVDMYGSMFLHDPSVDTTIAPYPFPETPSWRGRYDLTLQGRPHRFRSAGFDQTFIRVGNYFQSGLPARDWTTQVRAIAIPHWFLLVLLVTPWLAVTLRWLLRRLHAMPAGCCPTCGYDVRATPDRCPECGVNLHS